MQRNEKIRIFPFPTKKSVFQTVPLLKIKRKVGNTIFFQKYLQNSQKDHYIWSVISISKRKDFMIHTSWFK